MSKIIDLIQNKSSQSNNSNEMLDVLLDFEKNQKRLSGNSSAYLYYNSDFYIELIMSIGLYFLIKNFRSDSGYQLSDYELEDIVYYKNKSYVFKGKRDNDYVELHLYNKKNQKKPLVLYVPINLFLKNSSKIKALKRSQSTKTDKLISNLFGIDKPNNKVNYQTIILTEKKNIDILEKTEFELKDENYLFPYIVTSKYITATGRDNYLSNTAIKKKPILIFTSDIINTIELVEEYEEPANLQVFVLGGKWHKHRQSQNLGELIEICKDLNVSLNLYSAIFSVFSSRSINNLRKIDEVTSWLNPRSNLLNPTIEFKYIPTNEILNNNVLKLLKILEDIQEKAKRNYYYISLAKKISFFLNLSFSQIKGSTDTLSDYKSNIVESMKLIEKETSENLSVIFDNIFQNRYGFNVYRELKNIINNKEKTAVIIPNELVEETRNLLSNQRNIEVFSYNERIITRMYYTFKKIVLINPKPFERRRWILSNLAEKVYILYPAIYKSFKSLNNDKVYIEELLKYNRDNQIEVNPYLRALNNEIKQEKIINNEEHLTESLEEAVASNEEDKIDERENALKKNYYEEYLMNLELNTESNQKDKNQKVTVTHEILLQNGYIFGTENAKFNILNSDNYIEEKDINDIESSDIIIEFKLQYSDEDYRMGLKELYYGNINSEEMLGLDDNIFWDYYWKDELLRHLEKHQITPLNFKRKLESQGFKNKSTTFYSVWSDISKIPIAPQNSRFILEVGKMINNEEIIENYNKYFIASKTVKKLFTGSRDALLSAQIGKHFNDLEIKDYNKEIVISIDEIEISNISRSITNKIWKDE